MTDSEEKLDRIVRTIDLSERLCLILLQGPAVQAHLVLSLIANRVPEQYPVLWHRLDREGPDLALTLSTAGRRPVLMVHGLEKMHPSVFSETVSRLNLLRDTLGQRPAAVLLFIPEGWADPFRRLAPDLFAWRSLWTELSSHEVEQLAYTKAADRLRARTLITAATRQTLHPWEQAYLRQRHPTWEQGRSGLLLSRAGSQSLERAKLYVPLKAVPDLCWESDDGKLHVADPESHEEQVALEAGPAGLLTGVAILRRQAVPWTAAEEQVAPDGGLRSAAGKGNLAQDAGRRTADAEQVAPDGGLRPAAGKGNLAQDAGRRTADAEHVALEAGPAGLLTETSNLRRPTWLERALCAPELHHVVVEGEVGSGKTVLLQHIASTLAREHLGLPLPEEHHLELALLAGDRPLAPIPLLFEARALGEANLSSQYGVAALIQVLQREVAEALGEEPPREVLLAGLKAGRYLVLIDALDEVLDPEDRRQVVQLLEGVASLGWGSRTVLTTRPAPVASGTFTGGLKRLRIGPLDDELVARMVHRWCLLHARDRAFEQRLMAAVWELSTRSNLSANPVLLSGTLQVYTRSERLPGSAAELYRELVDVLCESRCTWTPSSIKRQMLELVSEGMQRASGAEWLAEEAVRWLHSRSPAELHEPEQARQALERLSSETGLLRFEERHHETGPPELMVRPWHRSFQEYLTACRLAAAPGSVAEETDKLLDRYSDRPAPVEDPAWEGVLRFLVGVHGFRGTERARAYVERLHEHALDWSRNAHPRLGRLLGLVASGLGEYGEYFPGHPLLRVVPGEIVAAFERGGQDWPLADRLLALEALGRLGDPRLDGAPWVEIPAGHIVMGGDPEAWNPAPDHTVSLSGFRLAWRPVTVTDFRPFVEEGSYGERRWWSAGGPGRDVESPANWALQLHHPSRPVVGVSLYEALAFCRWATERRVEEWEIPPGWGVDLPTEAEWEYAARGPQGDVYPWGSEEVAPDGGQRPASGFRQLPQDAGRRTADAEEPGSGDEARGLSREVGLHHPAPVGTFPRGNRGRLADLAGNVAEWCLDSWRDPRDGRWPFGTLPEEDPCFIGSAGAPRVTRGGSWFHASRHLRSASRSANEPGSRSDSLGFRVVCRPRR